MRDYIKKQLEKVSFADLSNFDAKTNTYHIPKYSKPTYELNNCYLVALPNTIVANTTSVLATNWNNGTAPATAYLKIFVNKVFGKNIYVDSISWDPNTKQDLPFTWSGWLPLDSLKQIAKI